MTKPIHYHLYLEPDLEQFTFSGNTQIDIQADEMVSEVVLNACDLDIQRCSIYQKGLEQTCSFLTDPQQQTLTVILPEPMVGQWVLDIAFHGVINDLLVGFYRSKYEFEGQTRYIAVTQFEERDARRAFPCFDEPALKATFDIEFLIDRRLAGLANTPVIEETIQGDKKKVRFERTPLMSTYLLFFGVGEFEMIQDDSAHPLVRVITTPGKARYGDFALQMARRAIQFGTDYTQIPYPITKCDHIGVPDFAFGAMENYGAITYRENVLLVYPGVTSKPELSRIASIIAHETIHMWFGDLVSPADWKYVWLNESFASYFTVIIPDLYFPEWQLWDTFLGSSTLSGLERDSLLDTVPIELPDGQEAKIDASSAPIVYNKGAAVIRMLADYLGEEQIKKGIHRFLQTYQFDSVTSQQYWEVFEQATGEPIGQFARSWVYQPGYPLVTARRKNGRLRLSQQRLTFLPCNGEQAWFIPLNISLYRDNGEVTTIRFMFKTKTATLPIPDDVMAFKVNAGQTGFYRVRYEADNLHALGRLIAEKRLSAADSFGVENDLFALLRRGDCSMSDYLAFVETYLGGEERFLPLNSAMRNLLTLYLVWPSRRFDTGRVGRQLCARALERMGMSPQDGEPFQMAGLRDDMLWAAHLFGLDEATAFGAAQFARLRCGESVHADILSGVMRIGAAVDEQAIESLLAWLADADTPETQKISALTALGCLSRSDQLERALAFNFEQVPRKNKGTMIVAAAGNPTAHVWLWNWLLENMEKLSLLHPLQLERALIALIPVLGCERQDEVRRVFQDMAQRFPDRAVAIYMGLEMMDIYAGLRSRNQI